MKKAVLNLRSLLFIFVAIVTFCHKADAAVSVTITSPTSTTIVLGNSFTFTATASTSFCLAGGIAKVNFSCPTAGSGLTTSGTDDATSPYSMSVLPTAVGVYVYTATATDKCSVSNSATITVTVIAAPSVSGGGTICGGSVLTASGGIAGLGKYIWYNSPTGSALATGSTYQPNGAGTYYATYTVNGVESPKSAGTAVTAVTAAPVLSTAPTSGSLYLSYPFTGNANDASGNSNNGTVQNAAILSADRYGASNSAYTLNGTNQYISTTTASTLAAKQDLSISIWFKTSTPGGKLVDYGNAQTGASTNFDRQLYMSDAGLLYFGVYDSSTSTSRTINATTNYADGSWHHAVATFSGVNGSNLYVDGALQATDATMNSANSLGASGYWRIGYDASGTWTGAPTNPYFTGSVDDVAIYSASLTTSQIYVLYGSGSDPVCLGSPLTLKGNLVTGATNYVWTGPSGYNSGSLANPNVTVNAVSTLAMAGVYTLTVTGATGCTSVSKTTAVVNSTPVSTFTSSNSGSSYTLTPNSAVATSSYVWDFDGGTIVSGSGSGPYVVQWSTTSAKNVKLTVTSSSGCVGSTTTVITPASASTFPGGYAYSKPITFKSLGIVNTVTNFPILLSIPASADLAVTGACTDRVQNPNGPGYDFAFVDPTTGTELNYQVDTYNKTTGALMVWVLIPSLNTNADFPLTFYYGAATPAHATGFSNQATWNGDYPAVYHFNESTFSSATGAVKDGSANARNATTTSMTAADLVAGNIGNAYTFGTNKKISSAATADITSGFTLSAWVKTSTTGVYQQIVTNQGATGGGYKMGLFNNNAVEAETRNASGTALNTFLTVSLYTVPISTWTYVTFVYNSGVGGSYLTFVNGNQSSAGIVAQDAGPGSVINIGVDAGGSGTNFFGQIDEVRICTKTRSNNWILAEYTNQVNPSIYTVVGSSTSVNTTLAANIKGGLTYTWTGLTSTDPTVATNWKNTTTNTANQLPSFTSGNATLVIPAGLNFYPTLTGNISLYGLTIGSGASLNLNGFTATVGCNIYNSSGGQILSNVASGITFNGTTAQSYNGTNTANTAQVGTLTVNNATGLTITGGPFDIYTALKLTSGSLTVDNGGSGNASGTGALTLKSTATQTAYVDVITSPSTVTGWVTTERYMPGGTGHRGYRLMSSPIYTTTIGATNGFNFKILQSTTPITGWGVTSTYTLAQPANAFDGSPTGNPSVFFYYEPSADPVDKRIVNSDYKGLSDINAVFPVANGFLFFYRGNRNVTDGAGTSKVTTAAIPENTTLKYYGTLNQGSIPVYIPTAPLATSSFTTAMVYNTTNAGGSLSTAFSSTPHTVTTADGYHLVGNPYASTIDLDNVTVANPGGNAIYMLNNVGVMGSYMRGTAGTTAVNGVGRYVLSGQGFLIQGNTAGTTTVTFSEANKNNVVSTTTTTPFNIAADQSQTLNSTVSSVSLAELQPQPRKDLIIRLSADSVTANETMIRFNPKAQNKYNPMEDAYYMYGLSQTIFMASYTTDNKPCLINQMSGLDSVKSIALYAEGQTNGTYQLKFTGAADIDPRYKLFLKDSFTNDSLDLSTKDLYSFTIDRGNVKTYGTTRFSLSVQATHIGDLYALRSFDGVKKNNTVIINWKTQYEGDYTNFTLQRSTDGWKTVTDLTKLLSNGTGDYSFTDMAPVADKTNEYRLVQNNIDNVTSISKVITIGYQPTDNNIAKFEVYPNPAVNTIQVKLNASASGTLYLKVYNVSGNLVLQTTGNAGNTLTENVTNLYKGNYVISVTDSKNKNIGSATFTKL